MNKTIKLLEVYIGDCNIISGLEDLSKRNTKGRKAKENVDILQTFTNIKKNHCSFFLINKERLIKMR